MKRETFDRLRVIGQARNAAKRIGCVCNPKIEVVSLDPTPESPGGPHTHIWHYRPCPLALLGEPGETVLTTFTAVPPDESNS